MTRYRKLWDDAYVADPQGDHWFDGEHIVPLDKKSAAPRLQPRDGGDKNHIHLHYSRSEE